MNLTLEYNGTEKSLADWGFGHEGAVLTLGNQIEDTLTLVLLGANYSDAPLIPFEATVKLYSGRTAVGAGGVLEFTGTRVRELVDCRPNYEGIRYTFAGPWYHIARVMYQQKFALSVSGVLTNDYLTDTLLFTRLDTTGSYLLGSITNGQQVTDILQHLLDRYAEQSMAAPFQIGTIDGDFYFPSLWCKPAMSSESMQKCLELSPDTKIFFDYSTSPPTIHVRKQSNLTNTTLAIADGVSHQSLRIEARRDFQARAVIVRYRVTSTVDGVQYYQFVKDKYGPHGANNALDPDAGLRVVAETVDLAGISASTISQPLVTEAVQSAAGTQAAKRAWWAKVDNAFEDSRIRFQDNNGTQTTIPDATILDEDGNVVDLSVYKYRLVDGAIAPWMQVGGNAVVAKRVKFVSAMTYAQYDIPSPTDSDSDTTNGNKLHYYQKKEHHVQMVLTNAVTGTYTTTASFENGENFPVLTAQIAKKVYLALGGEVLAGYDDEFPDGLAQRLQYEGEYVKVQSEISGGIGMGNNLNLFNGRAEWATMNAQIQSIRKDFGEGTTEVQTGIARHLGVQELANLLRMWRFRRAWQNPMIRQTGQAGSSGSVELTRNVPKTNTHPGHQEVAEQYVVKRPDGNPTGTPTGEIWHTPYHVEGILASTTPYPVDVSHLPHIIKPRECQFCDPLGNIVYGIVMVGGFYRKTPPPPPPPPPP